MKRGLLWSAAVLVVVATTTVPVATSTESAATSTTATSTSPVIVVDPLKENLVSRIYNLIQDVSYTYDPVGNITSIKEIAPTGSERIANYSYDQLNRLVSATVVSSSSPYTVQYSYNPIGNLVSAQWSNGNTSSYVYGRDGNINPHAPMLVGTSTLAYDANGNLTSDGLRMNTWDYKNRLETVINGTNVSRYRYDSGGERIWERTTRELTPEKITYYAFPEYTLENGQVIKHVMFGENAIARIDGGNGNAISFTTTDPTQSSLAVTDGTGKLVQVIDYYPYGAKRIDVKVDAVSTAKKQFIGEDFDDATNLSYLNARCYDGSRGQFLSQDPMFWATPGQFMIDPQQWNSYSYARNNPISGNDRSGLLTMIIPGTGYDAKNWSESGGAKDFIASVGKSFGETPVVINNKAIWSGGNNQTARMNAATAIAGMISEHKFADGEKLNIVGHSHGGNVGVLLSKLVSRKIDNLTTIGTPVRYDYQPDYRNIGVHKNIYSSLDPVQVKGGYQNLWTHAAAVTFLGQLGAQVVNQAGPIFEAGSARRIYRNERVENINASLHALNPFTAHSDLWANPGSWETAWGND